MSLRISVHLILDAIHRNKTMSSDRKLDICQIQKLQGIFQIKTRLHLKTFSLIFTETFKLQKTFKQQVQCFIEQ